MAKNHIELQSDTQTRPTPAMRDAMASAEVGDEQGFNDPTVNLLVERVAELFGKERAVFLPSGTMCNQISAAVHCGPGDEIIAERSAHIVGVEAGGASVLARAAPHPIDGERGVFTAEQAEAAIHFPSRYAPRSRVISVEQTANLVGGTVWPLETIREVVAVAQKHGLKMHMDGARILNAVVASGVSARNYAQGFDSIWVDLSKGLGCPVGAVLAGSSDFIEQAWRWKQRIGGSMRQAGVIAAAGVYALDHHVERMAEDHENAKLLATRLAAIEGLGVEPEHVDTNIVIIDVSASGSDAPTWSQRLGEAGVRLSPIGLNTLRALTHLDVTREEVERAADIFKQLAEGELAAA
ncbi:MAG: aminotransferase class I/II-fold pyridoxal phosphate-dependent enzyme [Hyphomicrobiaceae bacterium]|nr:aminotransferase class I/II-fold pyridoxal phosphate-dependent enzyme [Hyphomicrobiaceae bacterium]